MGPTFPRLLLTVHAHPSARHEAVEVLADDSLGVWVPARAIDGKANEAVERVLREALGLGRGQVHLVRGKVSRVKVFEVGLSTVDEVRARLAAWAGRRPRA